MTQVPVHTILYLAALMLHPALMQNTLCPSLSARTSFFVPPRHQHVYSVTHVEPIIHRVMRFEDTFFTVRTIIWSWIGKIGPNWSGRLRFFLPDSAFGFYLCISHLPSAAVSDFFPARPDILDKHFQLCFCSMLYSYHHFFIKSVSFYKVVQI